MYVPDNYDSRLNHDTNQEIEQKIKKLTICDCCKKPIESKFLFDFGCKRFCEECIDVIMEGFNSNYCDYDDYDIYDS